MIKINLLGAEATPDTSGAIQIVMYAGSLILTLVVCVILYQLGSAEVESLETETAALNTRLAKLKEQTKEAKDLENKRMELERISTAIGRLKVIQVGPVKMLAAINSALPAKAWIRQIEDKDGDMILSGIALDDFSVSTFLSNLHTVQIFKSVDLLESVTSNLTAIAQFNAFESVLVRYIVPSPERKQLLERFKKDADKQGLVFREEQPHTDEWKQDRQRSLGSANSRAQKSSLADQGEYNAVGGGLKGPSRLLGFGLRNYAKDPSIYAWSALEETAGKVFKIKIVTDFLKGMEAPGTGETSGAAVEGAPQTLPEATGPSGNQPPAPFRPGRG